MTAILRRLPFFEHATIAIVAGEEVPIRPYQIIVWVSLRARSVLSQPFPAVLDTGYSHYLSIGEELLSRWANIKRDDLRGIGRSKINEHPVELFAASLFLHSNKPGHRDELRDPQRLLIPDGVAVYKAGDPRTPRLPTLGLRTLVRNNLRTVINGKRQFFSVGQGLLW